MTTVKRLWARVTRTAAYRSWQRFGSVRGNLLAGGVTYFSFLSVFPAVALGFTIFGILLRGHPDWLGQITEYLDRTLPGFVQDKANPKGLIPLAIPSKNALSITGAVSIVGLVLSGLGWLSALRDGIRTVFQTPGEPGNAVLLKVRDLGVMALFGLGIVLSAVVTVVAGGVAGFVADHLGISGQGWVLTVLGIALGVVLDGALVALMLRVLSGVDLPWRGVRNGALAGGIGLTALKVFGTSLLAGTLSNPIYGSIALVVGLLLWLNFIARIILLSAAWAANDLDVAAGRALLTDATVNKAMEGPETREVAAAAPVPDPAARAALGLPTFGQRSADRTGLAAGAVLGAVGAAGVGAVLRGASRFLRPMSRR